MQNMVSQEVIYKTHTLEEIAGSLSLGDLSESSVVTSYKNKAITIHTDDVGRVDHIGFRLFDRSDVVDNNLNVVFDFVERYLLQLNLINDRTTIARKLINDKVTLVYGDFFKLDQLTDSLSLEIVLRDNTMYHISWKQGDKVMYALSFPINYELLLGMNKLEIENSFFDEAMSHKSVLENDLINTKDLVEAPHGGYYIEKGAAYYIESLKSDKYYQKTNDNLYTLLFDKAYPIETLANIMLASQSDTNYSLAITHHKYGNAMEQHSIPLKLWLSYCIDTGGEPYFGIEGQDGDSITFTVIIVNKKLGYNHILHFTVNKNILDNKSAVLNAKLRTYIPMHNVKDLYHNAQNR